MKPKKITTTKILVSIPWVLSFIILYFVIYAIINEKGLTAVATLGTMYGATISVGAFGLKYYTKKSSLENDPKVRLGVIQELIQIQRLNPDLKIYDINQLRQDSNSIINPLKSNEQKQYEQVVLEDITAK
ncbi:MAG: hypothetical protein ACI4VC_06025 [Clostridia bacterium]